MPFIRLSVLLLALCSYVTVTQAQIHDLYSDQGLTTWPTDIPANTVEIHAKGNMFSTFPTGAFNSFYQLETLILSENFLLSILPDITPTGQTLKTLKIDSTMVASIPDAIFDKLVVLEQLHWSGWAAEYMPNVPGPSDTLIMLFLRYGLFPTFPRLSFYHKLLTIDLSNSASITSIKASDFDGLDSLATLYLYNVPLTVMPDFADVGDSLMSLNLVATQIVTLFTPQLAMKMTSLKDFSPPAIAQPTDLPTLCTQDTSTLTLYLAATQISSCTCVNLWIRAAQERGGATVNVADATCDVAGGGAPTQWSTATTDELVGLATTTMGGNGFRSLLARLEHRDHFCWFPLKAYHQGIPRLKCILYCMTTPCCTGFGFRPTGLVTTGLGNCVIIAPSSDLLQDPPPDSEATGWQFYITRP